MYKRDILQLFIADARILFKSFGLLVFPQKVKIKNSYQNGPNKRIRVQLIDQLYIKLDYKEILSESKPDNPLLLQSN